MLKLKQLRNNKVQSYHYPCLSADRGKGCHFLSGILLLFFSVLCLCGVVYQCFLPYKGI